MGTVVVLKEDKRSAGRVLLWFCLFFVFCLPVYWFTSRVYRAPLPDLPSPLADAASGPVVSIHIANSSPEQPVDAATLDAMRTRNPSWLISSSNVPMPAAALRRFEESADAHVRDEVLLSLYHAAANTSSSSNSAPCFVFFVLPLPKAGSRADAAVWVMGKHMHGWITTNRPNDRPIWTALEALVAKALTQAVSESEPLKAQQLPHYTFSFTLLNGRPKRTWFTWEFGAASQAYLWPFLNKLSSVFSVSVDAQVLHFSELADQIHSEPTTNSFYVTSSALSTFVGNTKWNVVSPLTKSSVEFMLYVPDEAQTPLYVRSPKINASEAFIVPRWGAVTIFNDGPNVLAAAANQSAAAEGPLAISAEQLQPAFASFLGQLRTMLGLRAPSELQSMEDSYVLLTAPAGITDWELVALQRSRLRYNLDRVRSTLSSLFELLERVEYMSVGDHIQADVIRATQDFEASRARFQAGDLAEAVIASRRSLSAAEAAFFDPSMLPMLYFPTDHVYAVYAPFFVPVVLPVGLALAATVGAALKAERLKRCKRARRD